MSLLHSHGYANLMTAVAYYIIGSLLIYISVKVWMTNPVNRVFLFGDYLTQRGVKTLMACWPLVSLFGVFIFACAAEHHLHYLYALGDTDIILYVTFMGWIEAAISLITALVVIYIAARWVTRGAGKWLRD